MEIEIEKTIRVKDKINVDFPVYYKSDLSDGSDWRKYIVYAKTTEDFEFTIIEKERYDGEIEFEFNKDKRSNSYIDENRPSNKDQWMGAKIRGLDFIAAF